MKSNIKKKDTNGVRDDQADIDSLCRDTKPWKCINHLEDADSIHIFFNGLVAFIIVTKEAINNG